MEDDPISCAERVGVERHDRPSADRASLKVITIAVTIAATVYALDLSMPLGVAGGVPYVALVFVGWWFPQRRTIFLLAVISSVLTVAGYYFSPEGGIPWVVLTNRAYALFAIWGTAITLWTARKSRARVLQSEANLKYARNSAEAANRAKSDLLANMSHELRTPLNAIIGFSGIMKEEAYGPIENDKYREYLDDIHGSGQHLLDLINDILDAASIEAGALELHENDVNLTNLVETSIRIIRPRAEDGRVAIISSIDPKLPHIYVDERRVKQVMLNLLSNAVKFTQENGEISVRSYMNDNGSLSISVSDNGIGMADEETMIAMNRFGQVDSGRDRKHEGTGLGLPLTMGLMKLHGGTLKVESEKGHGTSVTVTLPKDRIIQNVYSGLKKAAGRNFENSRLIKAKCTS